MTSLSNWACGSKWIRKQSSWWCNSRFNSGNWRPNLNTPDVRMEFDGGWKHLLKNKGGAQPPRRCWAAYVSRSPARLSAAAPWDQLHFVVCCIGPSHNKTCSLLVKDPDLFFCPRLVTFDSTFGLSTWKTWKEEFTFLPIMNLVILSPLNEHKLLFKQSTSPQRCNCFSFIFYENLQTRDHRERRDGGFSGSLGLKASAHEYLPWVRRVTARPVLQCSARRAYLICSESEEYHQEKTEWKDSAVWSETPPDQVVRPASVTMVI